MPTCNCDYDQRNGLRTLHLEIDYSVKRYRAARVCGPPENCYPAEGGVCVEEVRCAGFSLFTHDGSLLLTRPAEGATLHPSIAKAAIESIKHEPDSLWQDLAEAAEQAADDDARAMAEYHAENESEERRVNKPR